MHAITPLARAAASGRGRALRRRAAAGRSRVLVRLAADPRCARTGHVRETTSRRAPMRWGDLRLVRDDRGSNDPKQERGALHGSAPLHCPPARRCLRSRQRSAPGLISSISSALSRGDAVRPRVKQAGPYSYRPPPPRRAEHHDGIGGRIEAARRNAASAARCAWMPRHAVALPNPSQLTGPRDVRARGVRRRP